MIRIWMTATMMIAIGVTAAHADDVSSCDTMTCGLGGFRDELAESGLEVNLGLTQIYQQNARGGLDTSTRRGRYTGSYDIEIDLDLEKLFDMPGSSMYILGQGSWPRAEGINEAAVGSYFGVNADAAGRRTLDVTELWFQQAFDDSLTLRLGKLNLTGGFECRACPVSFDGSLYANDETSQFLNNAFVNNPTIPFPDNGLGVVLYYQPVEDWYASIGAADARADARTTGFGTTFHGEDYFLFIGETGFVNELDSAGGPLLGAYRFGLWYDPQPKAASNATETYRDDIGFYLTFDQMLTRNNPDDMQGLGSFFRYGYAPSRTNDLTTFWSAGLQYQGLFEGREDDVMGLAYGRGNFSGVSRATFPDRYEAATELYYNIAVTPWMGLTPSVQYIQNPGGGATGASDSVVVGLRAQIIL